MSPLSGPKTYKISQRIIAQAASGTADAAIGEAEAPGTANPGGRIEVTISRGEVGA